MSMMLPETLLVPKVSWRASTLLVALVLPLIVITSDVGAEPLLILTPSPASRTTLKSPPLRSRSPSVTKISPAVKVRASVPSATPVMVAAPLMVRFPVEPASITVRRVLDPSVKVREPVFAIEILGVVSEKFISEPVPEFVKTRVSTPPVFNWSKNRT